MELTVSNKHTRERRIADSIIRKLKSTAATLKSNNPSHKDGLKYMISKTIYEETIISEFDNKNLSQEDRLIVREFINRKIISAQPVRQFN